MKRKIVKITRRKMNEIIHKMDKEVKTPSKPIKESPQESPLVDETITGFFDETQEEATHLAAPTNYYPADAINKEDIEEENS